MIAIVTATTSCVSTSFELDLTDDERTVLTVTYTIDRDIWELGVFDATNPDRAIPVSERDMQELAGYYRDVTLDSWSIDEAATSVVITAVYHIDSGTGGAGLAALWGALGSDAGVTINREGRRASLSLAAGIVSADADQRAVVESLFANQTAIVSLILPQEATQVGEVTVGSIQRSGSRVEWSAPMADAILADRPVAMDVTW